MVLVTGGNGDIGRRLAAELRKRAEPVRILALPDSRADAPLAEPGVEIIRGDVTCPADLEKACMGVSTVYHLAAVLSAPENPGLFHRVNTGGTENLLRAAEKNHVGHFIFVSSISVTYPRLNPYSASKTEAETLVRNSRIPWTIVRPCLVLDGEGGGGEYRAFVAAVKKNRFLLLPNAGKAMKRPLHVDDLVDALIRLIQNPITHGKTYALGGLDAISLRDMAWTVSGIKNPNAIPIPVSLLRIAATLSEAAARIIGRKISQVTHQSLDGLVFDAAPDIDEARRDLAWNPRGFKDILP